MIQPAGNTYNSARYFQAGGFENVGDAVWKRRLSRRDVGKGPAGLCSTSAFDLHDSG
jgi:hypothetical protein